MREIQLAYGRDRIAFNFDEDRFQILTSDKTNRPALTDFEIGNALDNPIASDSLEKLLSAGESVLIVASDATRATASAQIINLLVRRIIQQGIAPGDITIVIATGIHRPTTPSEKQELLTSFITQRINVLDHDALDQTQLMTLGND